MNTLAQIIQTGEIVEVQKISDYNNHGEYIGYYFQTTKLPFKTFNQSELDFEYESRYYPDYWARLEHQYAGMVMQGLMSYIEQITPTEGNSYCDAIVDFSVAVAHALVEKYKKEEK